MGKVPFYLYVFLVSICVCQGAEIDSLVYGSFGKIVIYHPVKPPTSVVLFVSGDGGWENGVINMAKQVASQGALVLGIDAKNYKKSFVQQHADCLYPASDFEELSLMIQKRYKFPVYFKPVLMGYSYGAVLIYGILAQAPGNTFKGAIALGFCPDIDSPKPLCKGAALNIRTIKENKTYYLEKSLKLTAPFTVLNGMQDLNCPYPATKEFLKDIPMAELVTLPKVGHGFGVNANWVPQFIIAYKKVCAAPTFTQIEENKNQLLKSQKPTIPQNLPLNLIPSAIKSELPLVFFISGDGGWTSFDQSLSEAISKSGMAVVGMDAQKYFWKKKTPEQTAQDISVAIEYYMHQWGKTKFILMGFSFGASVAPFIANQLTSDWKSHVKAVVSLSPSEHADFEIHIADMLNIGKNKRNYDVISEIIKIRPLNPVVIFGIEEDKDVKEKLTKWGVKTVQLPGGHYYNKNYQAIVRTVLTSAQ